MTTIYFVRVGETETNVAKMLSNYSCLTDNGRSQAEELCSRIKDVAFDSFYSSTMTPSIETADIIASSQSKTAEQIADFDEIGWGTWEGKKRSDFQEEMDSFFQGRSRLIPEGELFENAVLRMIRGLNKVSESYPSGKVCIIGHGGSGRMMVAHLLGIPAHNFFKLPGRNASVTIFDYSPDRGASFDTILYGGGLDYHRRPDTKPPLNCVLDGKVQ